MITNKRRALFGALAALVVAVLLLALWRNFAQSSSGVTQPPPTRPARTHWLVDADAAGAVVDDGHALVGVSRSGSTAWRSSSARRREGIVVCARQCPGAHLTASLDSLNSAQVPNPTPRTVGTDAPDATAPRTYRDVVFLDGDHLRVAMTGADPAHVRLDFSAPAGATTSSPTSPLATWLSAPGHRAGVTTTAEGSTWQVSFYPPGTPLDDPTVIEGADSPFACLSADGRTFAYSKSGSIWVRLPGAGGPVEVRGYSPGACAAVPGGVLVAAYSSTTRGNRTALGLVTTSGVRSIGSFDEEVRLTASAKGDLTYIANHTATSLTSSGQVEGALPGVDDALWDDHGDLVTVALRGQVRWGSAHERG